MHQVGVRLLGGGPGPQLVDRVTGSVVALQRPLVPEGAVRGQGGEDPGIVLADLRHPGLVVAGEEAAGPQGVPDPPRVVHPLGDVVAGGEQAVGVLVRAGGVLALLHEDVHGEAGGGVQVEGVVEPPDAVGLGVDPHEAQREGALLALRPPGDGEAGLDVLHVVLVGVPAQVHGVVEEEVELEAGDHLEVDHRVSAVGSLDVGPAPRLVPALEDAAHAVVDHRPLRLLLEGEGDGDVDVLSLQPHGSLLEERLVGGEPEHRGRVGRQLLDGHHALVPGPDHGVLLGDVLVEATLRRRGRRRRLRQGIDGLGADTRSQQEGRRRHHGPERRG